ncbi:MAG: thiol:disulfide interchange protein DsbA/DsbL [Succinivibrionaceae bacterium]
MRFLTSLFVVAVCSFCFNYDVALAEDKVANEETVSSPQTPAELEEAAKKIDIKQFKEGIHYKVLTSTKPSERKEVREFFSFYCGHCHGYYPVVTLVSQTLPEDVSFVQNPVKYLGGPMGPEFQKAFAAAVSLNLQEQFYSYVDKKIFVENIIPKSHEDIMKFVSDMGVPRDTFENQYKSFPIQNMANQYNQHASDAQIDGVPALVINNKYRIIQKELKNIQELYALITYLLNKDDVKETSKDK